MRERSSARVTDTFILKMIPNHFMLNFSTEAQVEVLSSKTSQLPSAQIHIPIQVAFMKQLLMTFGRGRITARRVVVFLPLQLDHHPK